MVYGEPSVVKSDVGITGTGLDTQIDDWNDKASQEWDDLIKDTANERRLITQLPELPLPAAEVTEVDKDGANNLIKARYYDNQKQFDVADGFRKVAKGLAVQRVKVFAKNKVIYGRAVS